MSKISILCDSAESFMAAFRPHAAELQGDLPAQTSVVTWTIPGPTRFQTRSADGWEHRARHCEQSQMPAEWQANDIGDVTG